jgi:enamine deaminase RidA (YjgF/YER057c/UK114 family)
MSQAVIHNNIVYLSGQVDATADDVVGQTKNILAKVDKYLQEAGTDKSKLLTSAIWLKDIDRDFTAMNEVWNSWIDPNNKPVRATTEASLASPKMLVEIQVTAAKD